MNAIRISKYYISNNYSCSDIAYFDFLFFSSIKLMRFFLPQKEEE